MLSIAAIIPTFNRKDHLLQTIRDLKAQVVQDVELQIIVVVDGSTDGTLEALAEGHPDVKVVKGSGNWWYTRSMNEGFEKAIQANVDYVLTLNDDIKLPIDYLEKLVAASRTQTRQGIIGSISVTESVPHRITFSGVEEITWWRFKYHGYIPHYQVVDTRHLGGVYSSKVLPGRGMFIPINILKELKGFDPKLIQYGSDDDFCLRAQKKGHTVDVCYNAIIYSYDKLTGIGSSSRNDSVWSMIRAFRNRYSTLYLPKTIEMIKRHGNKMWMPVTLSIVILGSIMSRLKYKNA